LEKSIEPAGAVMYSSAEFGFVRLADGFCSGSSLMPQKRNPDVFELARAKVARVSAGLVGLLTTLKGLPAGYSKDLQEDKAFLFDAVDTLLLTLPAVRGAVATMEPVPARMSAALQRGMLATDLADGLVGRGVPFREAHGLVGRLVREAEHRGVDLAAVPTDAARAIHPGLPELLGALGSFLDSVERRATAGGPAARSCTNSSNSAPFSRAESDAPGGFGYLDRFEPVGPVPASGSWGGATYASRMVPVSDLSHATTAVISASPGARPS
jgi:argininosuccinate lyase